MPDNAPHTKKRKRARRTLALDPDKLGLLVATSLATVVVAFCFFYRDMGGFAVVVRVLLTFAVAYVVVFLFVLVLQQVAVRELRAQDERRRKERAEAKEKQEVEEGPQGSESTVEVSEEHPGG